MANSYKTLGQIATSGAVNETLYTTPSNGSAITSTLSACALGPASYIRIACVPSGDTLSSKNYLLYDSYVNQYDSLFLTLGVTMSSGDIVSVYASGGGPVAFSLFGTEIT